MEATSSPTQSPDVPAETTSPVPTTTEAPAAVTTPATPARWQETDLPEDLRNATTFGKYETREQAFRALHAAQSVIGAHPSEVVRKPKLDDDASVRDFMKVAGLPDHIDAYKLDAPGADGDPLSQEFRKAAFDAGIPPKQMAGLYGKLGEYLRGVETAEASKQEAREASNIEALTKELGAAMNDTVTRADLVATHFGLTDLLNDKNLGTEPAVIKFLAQAYPLIAEDTIGGKQAIGGGADTPANYLSRADELTRQALTATDRGQRLALSNEAVRLRKLALAR